ncbi:MAG: Lrp/AsnC ligand binding domain-containing protein, partial [Candidatus Thorarchaeota archaeon]
IDFSQYGLPVKFFPQVRSKPGTVAETAHVLSAMDEIWDLHRTSEDYSLFATVRTKDIDGYNQFLRKLYLDENILDTQSQLTLEEWFIPI